MIATKSEGFPGVKQADAVEDTESIRFTIELNIEPNNHPNPPQIFISFSQSEFAQLRNTPAVLQAALRNKIEHTSFTDTLNRGEVRTTLRLDRGVWFALTVDGSTWEFNSEKGRWIKGEITL
jgi:hypothetical protein